MIEKISSKIISAFVLDCGLFIRKGLIWNVFGLIISISISLVLFFAIGFSREFVMLSLFTFILCFEAVCDILFKEVYLGGVFLAFLIKMFEFLIFFDYEMLNRILFGVLLFCVVFGVSKISKGDIGCGDAIMIMVMTMFLGVKYSFLVFILALLILVLVSLPLLVSKKLSTKSNVPFIPFLYASYFLIVIGMKL